MKFRTRSRRREWVWVSLILVTGVAAFTLVFSARRTLPDADLFAQYVLTTMAVLVALLGTVIEVRQPGQPIARLLLLSGAVFLIGALTGLVAESEVPPTDISPIVLVASAGYNVVSNVGPYPMFMIFFLFPTGAYLSRRWRWSGWLAVSFSAAMAFVAVFGEEVGKFYNPDGAEWSAVNPIGFIPMSVAEGMVAQSVSVMLVLVVGGFTAIVVRYRRSDVVVRTQIRWLLYAAVVAVVALLSTGLTGGNEVLYVLQLSVALAVIPVAITIAVTRHRLFEIDRLISRTLSYALVIGMLGILYVGAIGVLTTLLPAEGSLAVAGSTLAVAAAFQPVRRRVQSAVDRRFNRSRFLSDRVSEEFASEMGTVYSLDDVARLTRQTVGETLQPATMSLWIAPEPVAPEGEDPEGGAFSPPPGSTQPPM